MAGKEHMRLTDAAIARLRPHEREYTVWDTRTPGLGVQLFPRRSAPGLRPLAPFQCTPRK